MARSGSYDVAVIGAGVAGLFCANLLAARGLKVLLLEQFYHAGGCLTGFWRKGFYFNGGCQSFESQGAVIPLLAELGLLEEANLVRDKYRLVTPDLDVQLTDLAAIRRAFVGAFPHEREGLTRHFTELERILAGLHPFVADGCNPLPLRGWKRALATFLAPFRAAPGLPALRRWRPYSEHAMVAQHVKDPRLQAVLGQRWPEQSALVGALWWYWWLQDYWTPRDGMQAFCDLLVDAFQQRGGEVRFRTPVEQILVERGTVTGVVAGGERIPVRQVVACGDYRRLMNELLPAEAVPASWQQEFAERPVYNSIVYVYLGVDYTPEEMRRLLQGCHVHYFPSYNPADLARADDPELHRKGWIELVSPSMHNPNLAPEGQSSLVIGAVTNYDWMGAWHGRTGAYRELKRSVGDELIDAATNLLPELRQRIRFRQEATPRTVERYTWNTAGSIDGWTWDPHRSPVPERIGTFDLNLARTVTPIRGLYTAGHWTMSPGGVPTAVMSARFAANRVAANA